MSQSSWNANYNSAKGALLVGDGTRPEIRTVGADGTVLTANSANADGVEWAATPAVTTPAFFSNLNVTDANVTGAGGGYLYGQGGNLIIVQQGGVNLSAAGVFTAPSNGWYQFNGCIALSGVTIAMTNMNVVLLVNAVTLRFGTNMNPGKVFNVGTGGAFQACHVLRLAAGDTVRLQCGIGGGGGNTVDVTAPFTSLSGCKVASF